MEYLGNRPEKKTEKIHIYKTEKKSCLDFFFKNCGIHCLQQTGQRGGEEFEKKRNK